MSTVLKSNNLEGLGLTTGDTLNTSLSTGGGQDQLVINAGAGNSCTVSTTDPISGSWSLILTQAGANQCEFQVALDAQVTDFSTQWEWTYATPAVHTALMRTWVTTGFATSSCTVFARTDGKFHIYDTTSATQSSTSTAAALTPGNNYTVQYRQNGTTANLNIYDFGTTTLRATITMTVGSVSIGSARFGISTANSLVTWKFDNIKLGTGGFLARDDVTNDPPTASVGADQYVVVGTTVNLVGTDSDTDGTVVSRAWTWSTTDTSGPAGTTRRWAAGPTITGSTTQNASATMSSPGAFRAEYVVTDDAAATSTPAYTNVFVYPASDDPVAVRDVVLGTWTRVGGTDDTAVLAVGESDTTGHQSPNDPTGDADTLLMMPHGPGRSAGAVRLVLRGNSAGAGAGVSRIVEWYLADGTTLLGDHTQTAPTALGDQTFELPGTGLTALGTAVADSAELVVKVKATAL